MDVRTIDVDEGRRRHMAKRKPGRPRRIPQPSEYGPLLTVAEAAQCLNISESAMRRAIYQHDIPVMRFGRCMKLSQIVIERILEAGEFEAGRVDDLKVMST